jgi:hypothetical protein
MTAGECYKRHGDRLFLPPFLQMSPSALRCYSAAEGWPAEGRRETALQGYGQRPIKVLVNIAVLLINVQM